MAGRGRKPIGPRDLCVYFAEIEESDGNTSVNEEFTRLIQKCIEDKIFSENQDQIAVCRSETTSQIKFVAASWLGLRNGLNSLQEIRVCDGAVQNPIGCIDDIVSALKKQAEEDTYEGKKIIFFASLISYVLSEEEVIKIAEKIRRSDIFISIILPDAETGNDLQQENARILGKVFDEEKYDSACTLTTMKEARRQILNTQSKKATRPFPWNAAMEISPQLILNVGGYVCTRKNKIGEMTKVIMKHADVDPQSGTGKAIQGGSSSSNNLQLAITAGEVENNEDTSKSVVVQIAKDVLEKEKVWTTKDGTEVHEEYIGQGYHFGDKIISYNEIENEGSYESGEKCLKVLVFCPKENVSSAYLVGDGCTLFYPKKDDMRSEVMFKALLQAMINTNRIAVARKVYRKNTRVSVGALFPDNERQCLVFTEFCYADDISIPHLPLLIKPEDIGEDANKGISENESIIDDLIKDLSIDFTGPQDGPSDPAGSNLKETASRKVLQDLQEIKPNVGKADNIDIFFEDNTINQNISSRLLEGFPLKINKLTERLAGSNIFRKRQAEAIEDVDKKPKLDVEPKTEGADMEENIDEDGYNDLLDEL